MKKLFLLLAFTGIVDAASATTVTALTKGTVIILNGDDKKQEGKKQDDKKKCEKKSCCKKAEGTSGCSAAKTAKAEVKSSTTTSQATAEVKGKPAVAATPAPASK